MKILIGLSGWLLAVLVGVLDLPAKINSFFVEAPKSAENISNWLFLNTKLTGTRNVPVAVEIGRQASIASGH